MVIEAHIVVRELPHDVLDSFLMARIYGCGANELEPGESSADDKDSGYRFHSHDVSAEQIWFHGESSVGYLQPAEIPVRTSRISKQE
jgi:hypothetical protein